MTPTPSSRLRTSWWRAIDVLRLVVAAVVFASTLLPRTAAAEDPVRLYAAGSLRASLTEVADRFTAQYSIPVRLEFGASGLLRERLERGEPGDVFAHAGDVAGRDA